MKKTILSLLLVTSMFAARAEKYFTKSATIQFNASSPIEDIHSKNGSVVFVLNTDNGEIQTSASIKSFVFDKQLMQEHFNENYLESEKFPKSTFKGVITNYAELNYKKDGTYTAKITGNLTLHGVTKNSSIVAKIIISSGKINVDSEFNIKCSDYNIAIPSAVKEKVANQVKISIKGTLEKM